MQNNWNTTNNTVLPYADTVPMPSNDLGKEMVSYGYPFFESNQTVSMFGRTAKNEVNRTVDHDHDNDPSPPPQNNQSKEDDKMPLFLIKLWNIVEDAQYQNIIRWDESGYSFHILDPYSFCRNVLPHYFKHNNLNSLIRQLNMYGFRKMTPLDRGGLTRSESDQDHLEFSHPYFVREHPELLINIKRKASSRTVGTTDTSGLQSNLNLVMDEIRTLREKQKNMDSKMSALVKENETLWEQVSHVRAQHHKQQQVVSKLVQFLVALVQPNGGGQQKNRIAKRGLLAIDEPPNKRVRSGTGPNNINSNSGGSQNHLADVLDRLQRELIEGGGGARFVNAGSPNNGPIIADVTDELATGQVPTPPSVPPTNQVNMNYARGNMTTRSHQAQGPYTGTHQNITPTRVPMVPRMGMDQPSSSTTVTQGPYMPPQMSVSPLRDPNSMSPYHMNPNPNPAISLSPSIDKQLNSEMQEYLNGMDAGIDTCRDLIGGQWDFDFGPESWEQLEEHKPSTIGHPFGGQMTSTVGGSGQRSTVGGRQQQLALEGTIPHGGGPSGNNDPLASPNPFFDGYPTTPELLTPCTSPR